jgi:hypothetical protein
VIGQVITLVSEIDAGSESGILFVECPKLMEGREAKDEGSMHAHFSSSYNY